MRQETRDKRNDTRDRKPETSDKVTRDVRTETETFRKKVMGENMLKNMSQWRKFLMA